MEGIDQLWKPSSGPPLPSPTWPIDGADKFTFLSVRKRPAIQGLGVTRQHRRRVNWLPGDNNYRCVRSLGAKALGYKLEVHTRPHGRLQLQADYDGRLGTAKDLMTGWLHDITDAASKWGARSVRLF